MKKIQIIALLILLTVCGLLYTYKDKLLEQPLTNEQRAVELVERIPEVSQWLAKFDGPNRVSTVSGSQAYVEVESENEEGYIVWVYSMVPDLGSTGEEITRHAVTFDRWRVSKDFESVTKIERESTSTHTAPAPTSSKPEGLPYMNEREWMDNIIFTDSSGSLFVYVNGYFKIPDRGEQVGAYTDMDQEYMWFGDIDGSGVVDGFALARFNGGGSGNWFKIFMVKDISKSGESVTSALELSDDVGVVNEVVISPGTMTVDLYYRGPGDPNCCSTKHRKETYTYNNGVFTKASVDELGDRPQE